MSEINAIDKAILAAFGIPMDRVAGMSLEFKPNAAPILTVRIVVDDQKCAFVHEQIEKYRLVPIYD